MQTVPDVDSVVENLKALLVTLSGPTSDPLNFQTVTRIWQPWDQLANVAQPAIIIVEPDENEKHRRGQQGSIELTINLVVYARGDNTNEASTPASVLNALIKRIRTALLPSGSGISQNIQNLGGLVSDCYISGRVRKDAGVLDEQMSALIPVVVTIP